MGFTCKIMTFDKNSRPFNANQIILTLEKFQKFLHHISQHICNFCNAVKTTENYAHAIDM